MAGEEAGDAAFGGVLKARRSAAGPPDPGKAGSAGPAEARTQELLDAYFGADEQLPEGERFLKSFIRDRVRPGRDPTFFRPLTTYHALPEASLALESISPGWGLSNKFHFPTNFTHRVGVPIQAWLNAALLSLRNRHLIRRR